MNWTVVPQRSLNEGKSRLASVLQPSERRRLNELLLRRVLAAAREAAGGLDRCVLVTQDDGSASIAAREGAWGLKESGPIGLNAAIGEGVRFARERGAESVLVIAADIPLATGEAITRLWNTAARFQATIVADKCGTGTNAVVLQACRSFRFLFGRNSLVRHVEESRANGLQSCVVTDALLGFDVDTPEDLGAWSARDPAGCHWVASSGSTR